MIQFTLDEARVLGVLIEKALTTPAQYPLTLNSLTSGCNQKSNRLPVVNFSEDRVLDAVEKLRGQSYVTRVDTFGSRVAKFRHLAKEALDVGTLELAILAELMLRGPQTLGEIRTRASRMRTLESLESTRNVIDGLMQRPQPFIKRLPPNPGSRAERYAQLLTPLPKSESTESSESTNAPAPQTTSAPPTPQPPQPPAPDALNDITDRLTNLESENAQLKQRLDTLEQLLQ